MDKNISLPKDHAIGSTDAPVTVIDYSSFSCTHCKTAFEELIRPLHESYVKQGKVLLIMRHFPLDYLSFSASVFLECYRQHVESDNDKFLNITGVLFDIGAEARNKEDLTSRLDKIILDSGLSESVRKEFSSCMNDLDVKNEVLHSKLFAIKQLEIAGTPVLYINGERYTGKFNFSNFSDRIERALGKK